MGVDVSESVSESTAAEAPGFGPGDDDAEAEALLAAAVAESAEADAGEDGEAAERPERSERRRPGRRSDRQADADPEPGGQEPGGRQEGSAEVGPEGYPLNTPVKDMTPEQQAAYWRAQAKKHEKTVKAFGRFRPEQVKEMAERLREIEDAQKSEAERLAERLAEVERRAREAELAKARLLAASTHSVPASLVERLAGETEEEILEAAEALAEGIDAEVERRVEQRLEQRVAERLAELEQERKQQSSARGGWPVESLRPGAMPANEDTDPNEAFRQFLMGGRR